MEMIAEPIFGQLPQPAPALRLLIELPSRPRVFLENLRDLVLPRRLPPLELRSAPAPFWSDVFVRRPLPWTCFAQSGAYHFVALALLLAFTRFFALQPQVVAKPAFDRSQVIYYQPSEYLPPLDTHAAEATRPMKADPELARQPIISLPNEADNRSQTIVTPPAVRLKSDVALPNIALPNMVAWSEKMEKPRLAIPAVPLLPAAEITRIPPQMKNSIVSPPPDAQLPRLRDSPALQSSIVAPPPSVDDTSRPVGDLNIARSSVIAPAPQLAVPDQRSDQRLGQRSSQFSGLGSAPQFIPPPPTVSATGIAGESFGARGRVIALSLHPAVGVPPNPAAGNRRGAFGATPDGRSGASGVPGAMSGGISGGADAHGNAGGKDAGGSSRKEAGDLPAGLYVGNAAQKSSPVAGDPNQSSSNSVNPNLMASARPPRVSSAPPRSMQPGATKLSEVESAVFGNRKFYSLTLNMPNLNSSGGSWVIHFAEVDHDSNSNSRGPGSSAPDAVAAAKLSQPAAIRKVDPAYPLQLMRQNVAGTVILYAIIRADGTVGSVKVLRGVDDRLDQFASQAVAQWQFQPATKNGAPIDVEATFQIPFRPPRPDSSF